MIGNGAKWLYFLCGAVIGAVLGLSVIVLIETYGPPTWRSLGGMNVFTIK